MSARELDRYEVIQRLIRKEVNGTDAAQLLHLSVRQVKRLKRRVRTRGARGLLHGNRGKPSNRRMPTTERARIITLIKQRYADFGPTLATEQLMNRHRIHRDPTTIRDLLVAEKLWVPKRVPAGSAHRMWRQRRSRYGEMLQFDGSYHHWLEDRGGTGELCLLAAVDDATGKIVHAEFAAHEGVIPVFTFWKGYVAAHGAPRNIYLDRFSTYKMTQAVAVENHELVTQLQRATETLRIELITAYSPQAKGRIERLFETLQDRFVKELRLAGIDTVSAANTFLTETYLPQFNTQFAVPAAEPGDLHRPLTARERGELGAIFARQETRVVHNDFTIAFQKQWYQLTKEQPVTVCKKDPVTIEERLDGSVWMRLRGKYLAYTRLPERPKGVKNIPWVLPATVKPRKVFIPAPNHPWRQKIDLNIQKHVAQTVSGYDISIPRKL
ncbi:MAG: ISNCY family transposase [Nitrospirota bacterium]